MAVPPLVTLGGVAQTAHRTPDCYDFPPRGMGSVDWELAPGRGAPKGSTELVGANGGWQGWLDA